MAKIAAPLPTQHNLDTMQTALMPNSGRLKLKQRLADAMSSASLGDTIHTVPSKLSKITTAVDIGRLVLAARQKQALSQQSFADLAGVGRRFISELENGKATLEFDKVLQVAAAIGIDLFAKER